MGCCCQTQTLLPRTEYDYSGLDKTQQTDLRVTDAVELVDGWWWELVVRVWANDIIVSRGSSLVVIFEAIAPTPDEPETDFVLGELARIRVTSQPAGSLLRAVLPQPSPSHGRLTLRMTRANSPSTPDGATIGVDLVRYAALPEVSS